MSEHVYENETVHREVDATHLDILRYHRPGDGVRLREGDEWTRTGVFIGIGYDQGTYENPTSDEPEPFVIVELDDSPGSQAFLCPCVVIGSYA